MNSLSSMLLKPTLIPKGILQEHFSDTTGDITYSEVYIKTDKIKTL